MPWNYYQNSSVWSRPYVGVTIPDGDEWTITGFEFYEAMSTEETIQQVIWDVRTTSANFDASGLVVSGSTSNLSYVDSGLDMTGGTYDYNIYKFTVTLDAPLVLAGGQDYYFSTMFYRGSFPDSLSVATVFSDGTGQIGESPDDFIRVWYHGPGFVFGPDSVTYNPAGLAFAITGTNVLPEPGLTGLCACAGLWLASRRRRASLAKG
jgi:hypothetical protein